MFISKAKLKSGALGRLTRSKVGEIGKDAVRAISKYLGSKKYLLGDELNTVSILIFTNNQQKLDRSLAKTRSFHILHLLNRNFRRLYGLPLID